MHVLPKKNTLMNIILNIVHIQNRDALLLCMTLSKRHDEVGKHIARNTNFCPVSIYRESSKTCFIKNHDDIAFKGKSL